MDQKHHITLRTVQVRILQQKDTVNTVFLQNRELDKQPDRASQVFADDQVLLSAHLGAESARAGLQFKLRATYSFEQVQQVPTGLLS